MIPVGKVIVGRSIIIYKMFFWMKGPMMGIVWEIKERKKKQYPSEIFQSNLHNKMHILTEKLFEDNSGQWIFKEHLLIKANIY